MLLWKVIVYKNKLKTCVERVNLTSKKEVKATILVLILTLFFLSGSLTNIAIDLSISYLQSLPPEDQFVKDQLQNLFNIADIATIITFIMESMSVLVCYAKIKKFRVEINKIFCINL